MLYRIQVGTVGSFAIYGLLLRGNPHIGEVPHARCEVLTAYWLRICDGQSIN